MSMKAVPEIVLQSWACACIPSTGEAGAEGSQAQSQPVQRDLVSAKAQGLGCDLVGKVLA